MSTIKTTTLSTLDGTATVPVNTVVNGTGTVAIRASFNVTSITDNGTGDYTVNFTTAMPDANYAISFTGDVNTGVSGNDTRAVNFGAPAAGSIRIFTGNNYTSPVGEDWALICLSVFR
jgi:hypothetical protein